MDSDPRARDAELVRRSAQGDTAAFQELFEAKHRRVYLLAYQILGDQGLAEDVVQETFVSLWKHCARYRKRFALDTWLRRIATNRAIDRWRSERKHPLTTGSGDTEPIVAAIQVQAASATTGEPGAPTARVEWRQLQERWDDLARVLTPQQRAAFVLREIEELPARDVAEALECSVSTVRSHISLARKALRAEIRSRFPDWDRP